MKTRFDANRPPVMRLFSLCLKLVSVIYIQCNNCHGKGNRHFPSLMKPLLIAASKFVIPANGYLLPPRVDTLMVLKLNSASSQKLHKSYSNDSIGQEMSERGKKKK